MSQDRIAAAAQRLLAARRSGARIKLNDSEIPRDFAEGYLVQEAVVGGLAEPTIGWKVLPVPNGPIVFAPILASGSVPAGGTWKPTGIEPAGIEVEIALRLGRDVPSLATSEEVIGCVKSAHVVFELCQSRLADPSSVPRHVGIADCVSNTGIVVGDEIGDWRSRNLKEIGGRLLVDGKTHMEGKSADPLYILSLLPAALASRGKKLEAGQIVITGSLVGMNWLGGKHALEGAIEGCGRVTCSLEAA